MPVLHVRGHLSVVNKDDFLDIVCDIHPDVKDWLETNLIPYHIEQHNEDLDLWSRKWGLRINIPSDDHAILYKLTWL